MNNIIQSNSAFDETKTNTVEITLRFLFYFEIHGKTSEKPWKCLHDNLSRRIEIFIFLITSVDLITDATNVSFQWYEMGLEEQMMFLKNGFSI